MSQRFYLERVYPRLPGGGGGWRWVDAQYQRHRVQDSQLGAELRRLSVHHSLRGCHL